MSATRIDPLAFLSDELDALKQKGTYFKLRVLDDEQAAVCHFDGRKVINLASNNYLGLTTHPKLREAALEATRKYGVGSGAVRTIAGTMKIHMQLEERIARLQRRRGLRRLSVRLHRQRRHRLIVAHQRRLHHQR